MTVTQSEDLDRLSNQWCQDLDGQQVYDCHHDEVIDAIKLLYAQCIKWKKNEFLNNSEISLLYREVKTRS